MALSRKQKAGIAAACVLGAAYAGGAAWFSSHAFPNTTIDGRDVSMMQDHEAMEIVKSAAVEGEMALQVKDKIYTLPRAEVLAVADEGTVLAGISARNVAAWPAELFKRHDISSGRLLSFRQEKAEELLKEQGLLDLDIAPVDAVLSDFDEEEGYTVIADENGWKAEPGDVLAVVADAAEAEEMNVNLTDTFAVPAAVKQDDPGLNRRAEELNRVAHHHFTVAVGSAENTLTGEMLNSWVRVTRDGVTGLDANAIWAYTDDLGNVFADTLGALSDITGQRYVINTTEFNSILADKLGIVMPVPETDAQKYSRETKNKKTMRNAERKAKRAKTEEEKAQIMAEAEASLVLEPEMIAVPAEQEAAPEDAAADGPEAGTAGEEKAEPEAPETAPEDALVPLTYGIYICNIDLPEQGSEQTGVTPVAAASENPEAVNLAAGGTPVGITLNAVTPETAADVEEQPAEVPQQGQEPVTTFVKLPEDVIQVPVLEADPEFQLGYGLNYVDVSIENQHVILFENARKVMETDCVTGTPIPSRTTHKGVFKIDYKQRNRILRGSQRLYASFVNYWMPFDGGIGLHDATWRGSFGGNIYKYGGSHGCVNLPLSFAKELYAHVYPGETVYVH